MIRTARNRKEKEQRPRLYLVDKEKELQGSESVPLPRRKRPGYARILIGALGAYVLFSFLMGGYQIWQIKSQLKKIEDERNLLLQQQQVLKTEVQSLQDPEVIEKIARESLGMVKQGETIVIPAIPGNNIPRPKEVDNNDITH